MCEYEFTAYKKFIMHFHDSQWLNVETYCCNVLDLRDRNLFSSERLSSNNNSNNNENSEILINGMINI